MLSEITVIVKNEEKRLAVKTLEYSEYVVSETDPIISNLIEKAIAEFNDTPSNVQVKISMQVE